MLTGKSILVTGGTGSFGQKFVGTILKNYPDVRRVIVFSRDELKQYDMQSKFPVSQYSAIRYFIGDVRDPGRLMRAFEGVDYVVHAAALKQVPAAEYNPSECIKTNVLGAENIIEAALDRGVKKVIALSTDKAAAPINLYGATKLCSDKLFISANNMRGQHDISFAVVRYGNVLGSRGSVVPFFLNKKSSGVLPITHPDMTRFNITLDEGVALVMRALAEAQGGEIFVPRIPSYRITDLAEAIAPECRVEVVGIRPGEKIHEDLITEADSLTTVDLGDCYVITPSSPEWDLPAYLESRGVALVPPGFSYNSGRNDHWLNIDELRSLIREHVDPAFRP
jgi:UDP-N-acetylglucosamine 4,6-dehydratase/5-epimerase